MTSCETYQEMISRMLDGDLSAEERAGLSEHVKGCPDCAAAYVAFRSLSESIGEDLAEPPAGLHRRVMEEVRSQQGAGRVVKLRRRQWTNLLAVAACFALIVSAALMPRSGLFDKRKEENVQEAALSETADAELASVSECEPEKEKGNAIVSAPDIRKPQTAGKSDEATNGKNAESAQQPAAPVADAQNTPGPTQAVYPGPATSGEDGQSAAQSTATEPTQPIVLAPETGEEDGDGMTEPTDTDRPRPIPGPSTGGDPTGSSENPIIVPGTYVLDETDSDALSKLMSGEKAESDAQDYEFQVNIVRNGETQTVTVVVNGDEAAYVAPDGSLYKIEGGVEAVEQILAGNGA